MSKQFQTLCLEKLLLKNVLVGPHEAKGDSLENQNKIKNRPLRFAAYNLYCRYIKGLGKETGEFFHHVFFGKLDNITQKQIDSMFHLIKAKKTDKNTCIYIAKLTLIKIIVYLVLNLEICFSIQKLPPEVFYKKKVLRNVVKFTGKHQCNFIKREALAQMFSCEFYEISKNTLFTEHLWTTASINYFLFLRSSNSGRFGNGFYGCKASRLQLY